VRGRRIYASAIKAPRPNTAAKEPPLAAFEPPLVVGAPVDELVLDELELGLPLDEDLLLVLAPDEVDDFGLPVPVVEAELSVVEGFEVRVVVGAAVRYDDAGRTPVPPVMVRTGE
jgi:hypothetical protein